MKHPAIWITAGIVALAAVGAGQLWLGYEPPPEYAAIDEDRAHRVFAYGTLRNGLLRRIVVGRAVDTRNAVLPGYRKVGLDIVPDDAERVEGELFEVSVDELRRLDRYERAGIRYDRTWMGLEDGLMAWVYHRIP